MPRKPAQPKPTGLAALTQARADAGAAYAEAARAYVAAALELTALDAACGNASVGGGPVGRFGRSPEVLAHPDFLPPLQAAALTSLNLTGPVVQTRLEAWLDKARNILATASR